MLVMLQQSRLLDLVLEAAREAKVHVHFATHETDLIAVPAFLAIVDPIMLSAGQWSLVWSFYEEVQDRGMKFLLIPRMGRRRLPQINSVKAPSHPDQTYLKFLMLRTRASVARRLAAYRRPEKRIVRLMYIVFNAIYTTGGPFQGRV